MLSCQANAIGRSAKTVREFLEKHYTDEVADSDDETIKLAIKALLEVGKNLFPMSLVTGKTVPFYFIVVVFLFTVMNFLSLLFCCHLPFTKPTVEMDKSNPQVKNKTV